MTSPIRTLVDLCGVLEPAQLEAAVDQADKLDLVDLVRLRKALDQMRSQPGAGTLQRLLDRQDFRFTDSELERRFLRLVRSARLPLPETGQNVEGFSVDFFWRELGLVVETDGLRHHRTLAQHARDRRRDQLHTAAGLVRHPNVLSIYGVDRHDGRVGLWSDFVQGTTLSGLLAAQGPLGPREAALVGIDVCRAVGAVTPSDCSIAISRRAT